MAPYYLQWLRSSKTLCRALSQADGVRCYSAATTLQKLVRARIAAIEDQTKPKTPIKLFGIERAPALAAPSLPSKVDPLVDRYNRRHDYLRISLTERCNLRCLYCMPEEGVDLSPATSLLTGDELIRLATLFVKNGVKKIRLTGGEPSIRKDIVEIVGGLNKLRPLGLKSIGMTTNGLALHRKIDRLVDNGLTHLNISLDTLDRIKFEEITRRQGLDAVLRSISRALAIGPANLLVKLNTVVMRGFNDEEVVDFVEMTRHQNLSVRFIEFMPFSGNDWSKDKLVPSMELLSRISRKFGSSVKLRDDINDTARSYTIPGFKGKFGFISSMSDHFCSTCNRLRITADGKIKVCLFDGAEISLRDHLRAGATDEQVEKIIGYAVDGKQEKHDDMEAIDIINNRPMILIGAYPRHSVKSPRERVNILSRVGSLVTMGSTSTYQPSQQASRAYSTSIPEHLGMNPNSLSHVDSLNRPTMVNVGDKAKTRRTAKAVGRIRLTPHAFALVYPALSRVEKLAFERASLVERLRKAAAKGPVLTTAQLAGILGAKQTSSLIPLCHPLSLDHIKIEFLPEAETSSIKCEVNVECEGKTGVEMEALMGVNISLLVIWDMLKAVAGEEMVISEVMVVEKTGGKSQDFVRTSASDLQDSHSRT